MNNRLQLTLTSMNEYINSCTFANPAGDQKLVTTAKTHFNLLNAAEKDLICTSIVNAASDTLTLSKMAKSKVVGVGVGGTAGVLMASYGKSNVYLGALFGVYAGYKAASLYYQSTNDAKAIAEDNLTHEKNRLKSRALGVLEIALGMDKGGAAKLRIGMYDMVARAKAARGEALPDETAHADQPGLRRRRRL